ncbi:MAG: hypothetical protein HY891_08010 [Deltaproteobacteria bacterium]|nr:hypothetical protein [Deltaproteobacteria bacterium]
MLIAHKEEVVPVAVVDSISAFYQNPPLLSIKEKKAGGLQPSAFSLVRQGLSRPYPVIMDGSLVIITLLHLPAGFGTSMFSGRVSQASGYHSITGRRDEGGGERKRR